MSGITLYGAPLSLYTGRARSYLIKAGIPYTEIPATSAHYNDVVLPKAGNRRGIPTIELEDDTVIRDGAAIIDHFEAQNGHAFAPTEPKQRIISLLFDAIGAEGLLRPAMHYRWNFSEQNLDFLNFHFETVVPPGPNRSEMAIKATDRMREAGRAFGVLPDVIPLIETLYAEVMAKLDSHFAAHPYLLGGRPCIGDFGLIAPMYGHLGRDPAPLALMQANAIRLFRWVERMNRPEPDTGEFDVQQNTYLSDDHIPNTLIELLQQIAIDFVPETQAAAASINQWLAAQNDLASGTTAERAVGFCQFEVRSQQITAIAQPYRFYLLKRVQAAFDDMGPQNQQEVRTLLEACNMAEVLDLRLSREIGRQDNLEVWL